jgi:hypothetical protein
MQGDQNVRSSQSLTAVGAWFWTRLASDRSGHRTSEQRPFPSQSVTDSGHGRKMRQTTGRQRLPGGVPTPGPAEFQVAAATDGPGAGLSVLPGTAAGAGDFNGSRAAGPHSNISSDQRHGVRVRSQSGTAVGREPAGPGVNCQTNSSLVRPAQRHGSGFQVTPGGTNKGGPHGNVSSGQHHGVHVRLQSGAAFGQERARPRVPA